MLLSVVEALDSSPSPPQFTVVGQEVKVMENDDVGHICLVSAVDLDGDKLWYSITGKLSKSVYYLENKVRDHQFLY